MKSSKAQHKQSRLRMQTFCHLAVLFCPFTSIGELQNHPCQSLRQPILCWDWRNYLRKTRLSWMVKHACVALAFMLSALFTTAAHAEQGTAYISDELYIFMHSGAGKNYRILGSVDAGTPVTLVSGEENNGFLEIIDDKQRQGWVETKFINQDKSLKIQYQELGEQLAQTQQALRNAQAQRPELQTLNRDLQEQAQQLQAQLDQAIAERDALNAKQQGLKAKEKRQLLTYGGAIAFIGLFLGIILTVILSRRKRYDGWA